MPEGLKDLYRKYVRGWLSKDELDAFRERIASLTDDDLWELMCEDDDMAAETMADGMKKSSLVMFDNEAKASAFGIGAKLVAAFLLLIVSSTLFYRFYWGAPRAENFAMLHVPQGKKMEIRLADGTHVSMNSGTTLAYDVEKGRHREVKVLQGEAFFDVTKDRTCPFHVMVGEMKIEVLGTSFNVRAKNDRVETSLFTGSVKLMCQSSAAVHYLSPGDKSIFTKRSGTFVFAKNDSKLDAGWKEGYLSFESMPLRDVLSMIEDWYDVEIGCSNERMKSDLLSGSFHNESLENVLKTLSMQYGFRYSRDRKKIIIKE